MLSTSFHLRYTECSPLSCGKLLVATLDATGLHKTIIVTHQQVALNLL